MTAAAKNVTTMPAVAKSQPRVCFCRSGEIASPKRMISVMAKISVMICCKRIMAIFGTKIVTPNSEMWPACERSDKAELSDNAATTVNTAATIQRLSATALRDCFDMRGNGL